MVYQYQCNECKLNFSIGWYHYGSGLPYHAETQLVCTACGVMHSIQHATGSTWFQRLRGNVTVDRMRVQSEPLIDPPKPDNPMDLFLPDSWTGDYPAYMNKGKILSKEFTVTDEISPTLIVSARDDGFFPGSEIYGEALKEAGVSIRAHFFEKGGHGFSLRPKKHPLSTWPDLYLQWLSDMEIIEEVAPENDC